MLQPLSQPHRAMFWSAPTDFTGDFVIDDPLAFDYLGQQVGNWLFGGLTTRTSRAQYVAVVLFGLSLIDEWGRGHGEALDDDRRKELFERWERLWAMAVHEFRGGAFARSDEDAIRGQRGVTHAWRPGGDTLPLDYKLIGRQSELGSLGAYLTSLRSEHTHLVLPGTLRPTSLANEIIEAFWAEPGSGAKIAAYTQYAQLIFEDRQSVPRKLGGITLGKVGELSRLSSLVHRQRAPQQARLWKALFEGCKDDTLRFTDIVRRSAGANTFEPRLILQSALAGDHGALSPRERATLAVALAYGDVQQHLLSCFNRAYAAALDGGWKVALAPAAAAAFGGTSGDELRAACARLLDTPDAVRIRELPMHGKPFLHLAAAIRDGAPATALEALMQFHTKIHADRRHASPWMRIHGGQLVIDVGAYGVRARALGTFPSLKLNVVRSLLVDLGRLA